jgi:hypothetical protein
MAQQRATSPKAIYDTLVADTTFMGHVGTRTFETGSTEIDSISIVTPGEKLPAIKSISGLEVVIEDIAVLGRRSYVTGDDDITSSWRVVLLAWPGSNGATLDNAARRIMALFSKATTIQTAPTPEGIGVIAQVLVLVPSDSVITS